MAKQFPGSVVFGQDADGHCSTTQPSLCVTKGIREYFQTGQLPQGDIGCTPDQGIFDPALEPSHLSLKDFQLSMASQSLANMLHQDRFALGVL